MPGTLVKRAGSCSDTARANSSTPMPLKTPKAVRGPTPEILMSKRNVLRSAAV